MYLVRSRTCSFTSHCTQRVPRESSRSIVLMAAHQSVWFHRGRSGLSQDERTCDRVPNWRPGRNPVSRFQSLRFDMTVDNAASKIPGAMIKMAYTARRGVLSGGIPSHIDVPDVRRSMPEKYLAIGMERTGITSDNYADVDSISAATLQCKAITARFPRRSLGPLMGIPRFLSVRPIRQTVVPLKFQRRENIRKMHAITTASGVGL